MPIDDEMRLFFADRGSLVATSTKDGPPPYSSKVLRAGPARGPWRTVYESDARHTDATLADGFLALVEYREQGGGANSQKVVVLDLPSGRAQVVDTFSLSAATFRGGGGGPPRPSSSVVLGGGRLAWVRLIEGVGGSVSGELRVAFPHQPNAARIIATSATWIRPVSLGISTLVYVIANGSDLEVRLRDLESGTERVMANVPLNATGGLQPFQPIASSGEWVGWVERPGSSTAGATLRAVNVTTGAIRAFPLGANDCPRLTGNPLYFALNCSGSGAAGPQMFLLDTRSWVEIPVARASSNGPFFLEATGLTELLWQDRVDGVRRAVLFAPTTPLNPGRASPAPGLVAHENAALGYRIGLPTRYRLALSNLEPDGSGQDFYSPRSEEEDRALCEREKGSHVGSPDRVADLRVTVHASRGRSAVEFVSAPIRHTIFTTIEELSISGHEAARVVHLPSGETAYFVIQANDRLYEIAPLLSSSTPTDTTPAGWLDQIALSFAAIPVRAPSGPVPSSRPLCGR